MTSTHIAEHILTVNVLNYMKLWKKSSQSWRLFPRVPSSSPLQPVYIYLFNSFDNTFQNVAILIENKRQPHNDMEC